MRIETSGLQTIADIFAADTPQMTLMNPLVALVSQIFPSASSMASERVNRPHHLGVAVVTWNHMPWEVCLRTAARQFDLLSLSKDQQQNQTLVYSSRLPEL